MNKKPSIMVSDRALEVIFGVTKKQLHELKIEPIMVDGERTYPVDEVVKRSKLSIGSEMVRRTGTGKAMGADTLKKQKLIQQVRKLKNANDQVEAGLVDAELFAADWADKVESIRSIISEIPELVKKLGVTEPKAWAIVEQNIGKAIGQKALNGIDV